MKDLSGYLKLRKPALGTPTLRRLGSTAGIAALLLGSSASGVLADGGTFDGGGKIGKDDGYGAHELAAPTYAVTAGGTLYQYGTGKDGNAYYVTYDGEAWSDWQGYGEQPAKYVQDPAPVVYRDEAFVAYLGEDGKYYFADGTEWIDISGDYEFEVAPTMSVYGDALYVYGAATDGYVYWKGYDGTAWGEWAAIGGETASAHEVYAVEWDGYNNVFWTDAEGVTRWNRFDGTDWTGAKALPGDYEIADAVYAVGYDDALYAMGSTEDGKGAYNVFTAGDGWSGWAALDGAPKVRYQPAVHVYEGAVHAVYTGGDGHGYYVTYGEDGWSEYQDLGDNYAYEPGLYEYGDAYHVTYTGEDGSAYYKAYTAADGEAESDY